MPGDLEAVYSVDSNLRNPYPPLCCAGLCWPVSAQPSASAAQRQRSPAPAQASAGPFQRSAAQAEASASAAPAPAQASAASASASTEFCAGGIPCWAVLRTFLYWCWAVLSHPSPRSTIEFVPDPPSSSSQIEFRTRCRPTTKVVLRGAVPAICDGRTP